MKIDVHISRFDLVRLNVWFLFRAKSNWIVSATVSLFVLIYIAVTRSPAGAASWLLVTFSSIAGGAAAVLFGFGLSLVAILFGSTEKAGVLGRHTYTISDVGFRETTEANDTVQRWGAINALYRTMNCILIQINSYLFYLVPRRAFDDPESYDRFWRLLNSYKDNVSRDTTKSDANS